LVNIVATTTGGVATATDHRNGEGGATQRNRNEIGKMENGKRKTHLRIVEALERLHHALFRPLGLKSQNIQFNIINQHY
jgi:hypothetical protein